MRGRKEKIQLVQVEEFLFLSLVVDHAAFLGILIHELVAPPGEEDVLWSQAVIIATAEV